MGLSLRSTLRVQLILSPLALMLTVKSPVTSRIMSVGMVSWTMVGGSQPSTRLELLVVVPLRQALMMLAKLLEIFMIAAAYHMDLWTTVGCSLHSTLRGQPIPLLLALMLKVKSSVSSQMEAQLTDLSRRQFLSQPQCGCLGR